MDDIERRVMLLEREIRLIREEFRKTSSEMQRTIDAATGFRDRVLAAMEKAVQKPQTH